MKLQNLTTQKCLPSNTNKRSGSFLGDAVVAVKRFFLAEMPVVSVPNVEQSDTSIQCRKLQCTEVDFFGNEKMKNQFEPRHTKLRGLNSKFQTKGL